MNLELYSNDKFEVTFKKFHKPVNQLAITILENHKVKSISYYPMKEMGYNRIAKDLSEKVPDFFEGFTNLEDFKDSISMLIKLL